MRELNKKTLEKEYPGYTKHIGNAFEADQVHIFRWWSELSPLEKKRLLEQIASIDFRFLHNLYKTAFQKHTQPVQGVLEPPQIINHAGKTCLSRCSTGNESKEGLSDRKETDHSIRQTGEVSLQKGEIAVLTVAGGHGTRLGSNGPKGTLPIAPISGKSIFQLHAEKIGALQQRYRTRISWYIMTSETNDLATQNFFKAHHFFGLVPADVYFFTQGMFPVVDHNGKLLMNSKSNIIMSPNGHGGTIVALREKGVLDDMKKRGIKDIFYHQVDNVLIKIADPVFIGYHLREGAEMSLKVVKKKYPEERVGIVGYIDGHLHMIEYSELGREYMYARNEDGSLKYNAGNIAVHMISINFLEKLYQKGVPLPYHAAVKKVPYIDENDNMISPAKENAIKFESFIFDILKHVKKGVIMEVVREDEFSPVKNTEGENSPVTARKDMINLFGRWLSGAGIYIPRDSKGDVAGLIEISPSFALDEEELRSKIDRHLQFNGTLSL